MLSEMRRAGQFTPTLILTARGHPGDVLEGFEAGADDYLTKPFELAILMARIRALLRRREWLRASLDAPAAPVGQRTPSRSATSPSISIAGAPRPGPGLSADADGSERPPLPDPARGEDGLPKEHAGGRLGAPRGHRHPPDRQLHRPPAALHRGRSDAAPPPADGSRCRLSIRGLSERKGTDAISRVAASGFQSHPRKWRLSPFFLANNCAAGVAPGFPSARLAIIVM